MTTLPPVPIPADGFYPDLPGQRLSGFLTVDSAAVVFLAPERGPLELPLAGLELRVSGIHHEYLLLSHPARPGHALSVAAAALVEHPQLLAHPEVARQLRAARGQERRGRMLVPGLVFLLVAMLLALWLLKDPILGWVADRVPRSVEEKLGDILFAAIAAESPLVDDAAVDRQLEALVAPLAARARAAGVRLDFHLAIEPSLNAFALPGGHVVIHSGLLESAAKPEELLGVVAHEIAHVTRRHSLRQMVGSAGLWVVFQSLFGDFSGLAGAAADGGYRLLTLSFSREQELDADAVGFATLVEAQVDPRGLASFFDRIEKENGGAAAPIDSALQFLSTHPVTAERKERLAALMAASPSQSYAPVAFDFAALKDAARTLAAAAAAPAAAGQKP